MIVIYSISREPSLSNYYELLSEDFFFNRNYNVLEHVCDNWRFE